MLTIEQIKDAQEWLEGQRAVKTQVIQTVRDALSIVMQQAEHRQKERQSAEQNRTGMAQ